MGSTSDCDNNFEKFYKPKLAGQWLTHQKFEGKSLI